jgi:hypothetical protein
MSQLLEKGVMTFIGIVNNMEVALIVCSVLLVFFFTLSILFFIEARKNRDLYLFILKEYNKLSAKSIELSQKIDEILNSFNKQNYE